MIKINNLTVRNFMSVGNQTQAIDFDRGQLTLVLGENLDLGGDDSGARNGTGKTTIINGLSYAIYGQALTNIKRDNLINKINSKGMLCTVTFEKDGVKYHIERGRKPNLLRFSINDQEQELVDLDESQGDSRETQKAIEEVFGMKHEMFKHLIALNTYTEPFLSMKAADQRAIIEQLLGITILSEKAEALKDAIKISKDSIATENTRIETVKASNERIQQSIESLIRKQRMWEEQKETALTNLLKSIDRLSDIDIDQEIAAHRALDVYNTKRKAINDLTSWIKRCELDEAREIKEMDKLKADIASLENHTCHSCGQSFHDAKQVIVLEEKH
jgi:DNA repair exonuclease SbcCD ATPase subunit